MQENAKKFNFKTAFGKYGIVVMFILLYIVLAILIPGFVSASNIEGILVQGSIYGIMALGVTFIIISGGTDLSAGSNVAMSATILGIAGQTADAQNRIWAAFPSMGVWGALAVGIIVGGLLGALNGWMIAKLNIFPFIATLGTYTIYRGLSLVITGGSAVSGLSEGFKTVGGHLGVIPTPVLVFVICIIVALILLNYTRFGCNVYALGGNRSAARVSGVNIQKTLILIYMLAGIFYGIAAWVYAGRVLSINAGVAKRYEMTAISCSIIGGTNPAGGKGAIWGVVVGTLIISTIRYGLTLLAVDAYWQQIAEGLIIVVAVIIAMLQSGDKK